MQREGGERLRCGLGLADVFSELTIRHLLRNNDLTILSVICKDATEVQDMVPMVELEYLESFHQERREPITVSSVRAPTR